MNRNVLFAYAIPELPADKRLPNRSQLFAKLAARSLQPLVSIDKEAAFEDDDVIVHRLVNDANGDSLTGQHKVPFQSVGLLVNRLDRSIKHENLPRPDLVPPMINENATRSLVWRKELAYQEALKPGGLGIPTGLVSHAEDVAAFLATQTSQRIMIKPRNGNLGRGMEIRPRDNVAAYFDENPDKLDKRVLQPAYDFNLPFPRSLKPYDAASQEAFEGWSQSDQTKELRMYGFLSPAGVDVFPAARVINGEDNWFFVDPESIPNELNEATRTTMLAAAEYSGALAMFGAVDYGYGSVDGGAPEWAAIEINGLAPYMIGYDKHARVADHLRTMFADQILATVEYNGAK